MDDRRSFQHQLTSLLGATRRRILVQGAFRVAAVAGPMTLLTVWSLGTEPRPGAVLALGLVLSLLAAVLALVWNLVLRPLGRLRKPADLTGLVEKKGDFANILVAAEESLRLPGRWEGDDPVRVELLRRVYRQGLKILGFLNPARVHPVRFGRAATLGTATLVIGAVVLAVFFPSTAGRGLERLVRPVPPQVIPPVGGIYPWDTADFVVAGEDALLQARDLAGGTGPAVCEIRIGQGLWQPLEARAGVVPREEAFLPPAYRLWTATLPGVREDFSWRFRRGTLISPERRVRVRHHPLLTDLAATIQPPAYTGLSARRLDRLPTWLEVPAGSQLQLQGIVNHGLRQAAVLSSDGDTLALSREGVTLQGTLDLTESRSFRVALEDSFGLVNQAPLLYEISALPDEKPLVQVSRPGDDGLLPLDGMLVLAIDAADDYGLTALDLQVRASSLGSEITEEENWTAGSGRLWQVQGTVPSDFQTTLGRIGLEDLRPGQENSGLRILLEVSADISALELVPGDVLELRIAATDNRRPGRGQTAFSRVLRLVLPSAAEVLASQAESSEQRRNALDEARRRGLELGADLDRLNRELMKNPIPDWARRQEMEQAIDRQKGLQEELARLAAELQKDLDRLAAGQMTSERMLEKAEEVAQLLGQDPDQGLQDLLDKMDQAGDQVSPQELAEAIREVAKNQKDMARRLDAALAMMERMEQEQELEGLTALLEQMIRKQQELADLSREMAEQNQDEQGTEGAQEGEPQEGDPQQGDSQEGEKQAGDAQESESQEGESQEGEPPSGEDASPPTPEELARRQEALAEELDQLKERMEQALSELEQKQQEGETPSNQDMQQALKEALENLEQQEQKQDMQKASEQLAQLDPEQAAQLQQEALRDLGSLYHVLLETQQAMQAAMQQNQVSSLRGLAADMLALSTRQEEIANTIPPQLRDVRSLGLTRSQHRLQRAAIGVRDDLSALLDESPTRIMRLLTKLDGLIEQMGYTVQAMEDNRGPVARRDARNSLADANRIVIGLLTEAQITSQSSSSGSGNPQQSMSQQLQQMAQEQAKLNGMTEQLRQMLANRGMSQEARSQMKRLGEAQGNLAGQLNELEEKERENPEGERLLGDLGELGRQMESIGDQLDDGLVSEETLVRQERILSRLLDARNSVRRRDYTTRRESRTATRLYGEGDQAGENADAAQAERSFRLRYQALEKAPLEYRDLVRRYFTALDSLRSMDARDWDRPGDGADSSRKDLP